MRSRRLVNMSRYQNPLPDIWNSFWSGVSKGFGAPPKGGITEVMFYKTPGKKVKYPRGKNNALW